MREAPEWIPRDAINVSNASLISTVNNCVFNFSSQKIDFSIEQPIEGEIQTRDSERLMDQVDLLTKIVIAQLELREFTRIGYRVWYLFRCQTREEAEKWLTSLGLYSISPTLFEAFDAEADSTGVAIVMTGKDRKYRVGLNGVERSAQIDRGVEVVGVRSSFLSKDQDKVLKEQLKRKGSLQAMPQFAAMIDFDAFQEAPVSVDARDFAESSQDQFFRRFHSAIPKP